jgi:hypothetical protein
MLQLRTLRARHVAIVFQLSAGNAFDVLTGELPHCRLAHSSTR